MKALDNAKAFYSSSIRHSKELGDIFILVRAMDGLGMVYLDERDNSKAVVTFEKAVDELAQFKGDPRYDELFAMLTEHQNVVLELS
jgi:hypothetical protein